ncbi:kinase-like domain-containing protein [Gautieria morchelliformis]|nr:kinase-like domain-containing protein [Gautieria morchelliformis]
MSPEQSPQLFTYDQYPCVEPIAYYRKGGLHPIHIDDVLHNRYRIVNKLGYGRFAALKALAADVSKVSEVAILRRLKQRQLNGDSTGQEFLVEYLDDFKVEGPNGTHQCIVTEVLGPSIGSDIEEIYDDEDHYPMDIAKNVVAQVMRGVAYLHSCGVVHGDLQVGNILFRILGLSRCLIKIYKSTWKNHPNKNSPAEMENRLHPALTNLKAVRVKICDFGEAFLWDGNPVITQVYTPSAYAAPEIILHDPVGPAVDVWALAVLMHLVLSGGTLLFGGDYFLRPSYHTIKKEALRNMVMTLGKLPDRWWTKWEDRSEYFDENGLFLGNWTNFQHVPGQFLHIPSDRMEMEELEGLKKLIRMMVSYEVTDRISAAEVVQLTPQSWMQSSHEGYRRVERPSHTSQS